MRKLILCTLLCASPAAAERLWFDGHADFAIHYALGKNAWRVDRHDLNQLPGQSDLTRWRMGHVGGMLVTLGSGLDPAAPRHLPMVHRAFDWFDRMVGLYSGAVAKVGSPDAARVANRLGRTAWVPAIEGAEQLDGNPGALGALHARGLRSLLIIYDGGNRYGGGAGAFGPALRKGGLTADGRALVDELNRLGILVDLSHASEESALDALRLSRAPVLFSHSGARALADTPRNLSDAVLAEAGKRGALVMIPLAPYLVTTAHWRWFEAGEMHYARLKARHRADARAIGAGMAVWDAANPQPQVGLEDVVAQIEHVAGIVGRDQVGIGSDFDGMGSFAIPALSNAAMLPALGDALRAKGWSEVDLNGLKQENFLRTWQVALDRAAP